MRGFTEDEALRFAEFARSTAFQVRFIEFMPLDGDHAWTPDAVLTGEEIRAMIDAVHPLEELPREPSATARVFRFADGAGEIGFINPVSEPFCADCNRIRLTAEGKLRTCLFSLHETDLRGPLREGAGDAELEQLVRDAVWRKELKHHVGEPGLPPAAADDERDRRLTPDAKRRSRSPVAAYAMLRQMADLVDRRGGQGARRQRRHAAALGPRREAATRPATSATAAGSRLARSSG